MSQGTHTTSWAQWLGVGCHCSIKSLCQRVLLTAISNHCVNAVLWTAVSDGYPGE